MYKQNRLFSWGTMKYLLLILSVQFLFFAPANAKAAGKVELVGSIQAITDSSITVNSVEVRVNSMTKISNQYGPIMFDSLFVGLAVRVEAMSQMNGSLVALMIRVADMHIGSEFSGRVTAITDSSITVDGTEIFIDTNTVIFTQYHMGVMFSNLQVGDSVSVKAMQNSGGGYQAIVIVVFTNNSNKEIEVEGTIQAITSNSIEVMNIVFNVDSTTVIVAKEKGFVKLSDLSVGQEVDVRGYLKPDSTYQALMIKVDDEGFAHREIEVKGAISAIDSTSLVVNNILFHVDSSTIIFAHGGGMLMFSDLKVGDFVEVDGMKLNDTTYTAAKIRLESNYHKWRIEVAGKIDSLSADNFSVGGYKLFVNAQTKFYNQFKQSITFGDLQLGQFVVASAYRDSSSSQFYASKVRVRDTSKTEIDVTGAIDTINGNSITVKNILFVTDQNTEFLDNNRIPITISDLKAGMIVHVDGIVQGGNENYAMRVKVEDFWRSTVVVTGKIDSLGLNSLSVRGKTFFVNTSTVIVGLGSGMLNFSNLTVGLKVEIKAKADSTGKLIAKLIKVHPNGGYEIYGKVDSLAVNEVFVAGLTIKTDNNTVYFDEFDHVVTFDSLKVGQMVEVKYMKNNLSENVAVRIEIESSPNSSEFNGVVTSVSSNQIQLSIPSFTLSSNTVFISSTYTPLQSTSIEAGQSVTVWATQDANGNLTAVQVQQISSDVTAVNNNPGNNNLPTNFELKQNYPNPFNPSTKISFTLSKPVNVSLNVYNILGERVTTLINGPMNAGLHLVTFNGSNLASGVYFYRLKAGDFVSVKKMVLIK